MKLSARAWRQPASGSEHRLLWRERVPGFPLPATTRSFRARRCPQGALLRASPSIARGWSLLSTAKSAQAVSRQIQDWKKASRPPEAQSREVGRSRRRLETSLLAAATGFRAESRSRLAACREPRSLPAPAGNSQGHDWTPSPKSIPPRDTHRVASAKPAAPRLSLTKEAPGISVRALGAVPRPAGSRDRWSGHPPGPEKMGRPPMKLAFVQGRERELLVVVIAELRTSHKSGTRDYFRDRIDCSALS